MVYNSRKKLLEESRDLPSIIQVWNNECVQDLLTRFYTYLTNNRFFVNQENESIKEVFELVQDVSSVYLEPDVELYRARKNEENRDFTIEDMYPPQKEKCRAHRFSANSVRYFYLSSRQETAISEVRPWIEMKVEVAKCFPKKTLILKDFTTNKEEDSKKHSFRKCLDNYFSRPISNKENLLHYLPTQCIAEFVRDYLKNGNNKQYDGIKYSSSVDKDGYNVVVFNPCNIKIESMQKSVVIENITLSY